MRQTTISSYNVYDMFELFAYSYSLRAINVRQLDGFTLYFDTEEAKGYLFRVRINGDWISFEIEDPTKTEEEIKKEMTYNRCDAKITARDGKLMDYIRKRRFLGYYGKA